MMIIGVAGFAGSGKGSVSDSLVDRYGFTKVSFADTLKDSVSVIFGWKRHLLEGDTDESREFREKPDKWWSDNFGYEVTPRLMLQKMGTEAGRNVFHNDIWIHSVFRKISRLNRELGVKKFVIPDTRFPNEIKNIKKAGGKVIRVIRNEEPDFYNEAFAQNVKNVRNEEYSEQLSRFPDIHYSEWAWIGQKFDYTILNNGTRKDLDVSAEKMIKELDKSV